MLKTNRLTMHTAATWSWSEVHTTTDLKRCGILFNTQETFHMQNEESIYKWNKPQYV